MTEENILDKIAKLFNEKPEEAKESKYDLKKPPGLVGEVTDFINSQCRYPRENLAAISAIITVGNIGGLNHKLQDNKLSSNLFAFCVAGSATGKEAVLQAVNDLHIEAGVSGAIHGSIKSEQEIIRNLIRHQACYYNIDEFGIFLRKLAMSHKSGGASYLQGVIGMLMAAYSKANGNLLLSGDLKEEIKSDLAREIAALNKKLDEGSSATIEARVEALIDAINNIDKGLKNPFLSLQGFTTPQTFNESVSFEQITSGFIGRSIIINETDTNPKRKRGFVAADMPESLKASLMALRCNGSYDPNNHRIESNNEYTIISTSVAAQHHLEQCADWFEDEADKHTEKTGFEAVVRRGYEGMEKVSFILAFGGTERTLEHTEWAFEYIKRDIEYKTLLAYSNVKEKSDPVKSMAAKILCSIGSDGITVGRLVNRYRSKRDLVDKAIVMLETAGKITSKEKMHKYDGAVVKLIYKSE